ncbi:ubiquitin carboxyl-terminal hydrolase 4/11/15 protein [Dioscorea alata]|uniref:Ubiquitin carboxyl-terminal hydrolase 4/11/15 protein n=1 Tax=Dioscorea alata TaxID=55571 RepID=A0ACB7W6F8_DIOAL|nr:ubiquitin carboxyl-terminal hydrolase 4/11/15 protein [Dioscorea alata]
MEVVECAQPELSREEERLLIRDITVAAEANSKEGDTFYLINYRWWQHWLDYVNHDMTSNANHATSSYGSHYYESASSPRRPPPIDNSELIYDAASEVSNVEMELHDTLVEGRDYILLPEEVWEKLYGWYGGGPMLPRKAISSGLSQTDLAIEVYPLRLQLLLNPKGERAMVRISKKEKVRELHRKSCEVFDLIMDQVCIWDYYGRQKHALMDDMEKTLDDANIQMDQDILVEIIGNGNGNTFGGGSSPVQENGSIEKDPASVVAEPCKSSLSVVEGLSTSKNASRSCSSEFSQSQILASPSSDLDNVQGTNSINTRGTSVGLTGLLNLGNTCFMNSAIQCLVHTPEFARYFREDYHQEINWQNPLGMVGELALAFGELLRKLWAPGRTPVSPRPFKTKLARFAPQFSGYNQHDSQELLAFLLDGLHEDLNRVKHKPYIKSKDADGRSDEDVADEYWANHIARNDSIIVDVCQGQYKSTLVCPVCGKVSVTFDPFMYLSLPIQSASSRNITVTIFTSDGSALPTPCTVSVPKQGRCKDLIQALSNACSLKSWEKLVLAEIRGHRVHQFLDDPLVLLSTIKDDDHLAAYKLPNLARSTVFLQLIHRQGELAPGNSNNSMLWKPFGIPLMSSISQEEITTRGDLNDIVQAIVHKMLTPMQQGEDLQASGLSNSSNFTVTYTGQAINTREVCKDSSENNVKDKESCDGKTTGFKLFLQVDDEDNACIDLSIDEEKTMELPLSSSFLLFINWSQNDLERYNTKYMENLPEVFKHTPAPKRSRGEPLSLYACLDAFLREEPLVPEDMWYCPRCKEQRQASKKLDLWRLPEVLVIHLKRFSFSRSTKHKLETFVNFPIHDFDLTNYVANKNSSQRQLYELYALSNHYGNMASGHYTAHIKMQLLDENRWYNFDDSHISAINEDEVKSNAAYVLFYRRVKGEGAAISNGAHSYATHNHNPSRR